ncbi:MAG: hypothetical protein ACHQIM_12900 [Sphingobacteriales bacterium]
MKKNQTAALVCCIPFLLSSCFTSKPVTSINGPAFLTSDISYQPKPLSADSVHHASYISASIVSGQGANPNDQLTAGELNLGMAYTLKHFNFACGAFGAAGSFSNQTIAADQPYYFNNKFVGVAGSRGSVNYYITLGHVDIRIIGIEAAYSHEFGDYASYRKEVVNQPYFYINTQTNLFTLGGSSEVTWYPASNPSWHYGLRLFIGATNGSNPNPYNTITRNGAYALAYFMQVKNYFMVGEITDAGGHFTLGYRF